MLNPMETDILFLLDNNFLKDGLASNNSNPSDKFILTVTQKPESIPKKARITIATPAKRKLEPK